MKNSTWNNDKELRLEWWNKMRRKYNSGLIISGIIAFILYLVVVEFIVLKSSENWDGEITIFTLFFQGIGYLIMIGLANLFYNLGAISERIIKPNNIFEYRNRTYNLGFWFSVCLPFIIPISLLVYYL